MLMPDIQNTAIRTLPIHLAVTISHHQQDITTYQETNSYRKQVFSCIDLIFCNNQNLISNYGVDLSISEKCHCNIIFGKINTHIPLPPSYVREV